ncbi:UPF0280 family protein [Ruegeria sp.]|uniref:UPF0280 family protein n=1 Tax=Ruegeria sp. TaxID=1879320 RepID=UPI00231B7D3F|nr:UPF0280 family protein [Ruegeria sp.]MDA7966473.1 UPF0280 family protein [Ruegeria sp.]
MGPVAALLPCGERLHLQHGPIDLIIGADTDRAAAFAATERRFETVLQGLVDELPVLQAPLHPNTPLPTGPEAQRMFWAARPFSAEFVTPMAAVAGAVADEVLAAMLAATKPERAYVNNGGDIAIDLPPAGRFTLAMSTPDGQDLGRISVSGGSGVKGIATSGFGGRSLSMGIADSVTVLAKDAATADVAATLIANAVDLPGHRAIRRSPANQVRDDSDLGARPVVVGCGPLAPVEIGQALDNGLRRADQMLHDGLILGAALFLRGHHRTFGTCDLQLQNQEQGLKIA